jgi:hypothetical protein
MFWEYCNRRFRCLYQQWSKLSIRGRCVLWRSCANYHSPNAIERKWCRIWLSGSCSNGSNCVYSRKRFRKNQCTIWFRRGDGWCWVTKETRKQKFICSTFLVTARNCWWCARWKMFQWFCVSERDTKRLIGDKFNPAYMSEVLVKVVRTTKEFNLQLRAIVFLSFMKARFNR